MENNQQTQDTKPNSVNKSPTIPGTKKEAEFFKDTPETRNDTIMPTMIDESEEYVEKKRDLSSIIPNFEDNEVNEGATELESRDNKFKSDATVTLAYMNEEGEVTISNGAHVPDQIDMEQRKKEIAESKNVKKAKKKEKKERLKTRRAKRQLNRTSFLSLCVLTLVVGFGIWYFTKNDEMDFKTTTIVVELGDSIPVQKKSYVIPGVGDNLNEIDYIINKDQVNPEKVGDYNFYVTYKGVTKPGLLRIVDTTGPTLSIRQVTITEGGEYSAATFVEYCNDPSGCNYSFQDPNTEKNNTTPGIHDVYIVATDAYNNSTTVKATLVIEAAGNLINYIKKNGYDAVNEYELTEKYELHFKDYSNSSTLLKGIHIYEYIYSNEKKYAEEVSRLTGEQNYTFFENDLKITYKEISNTIGNNYSSGSDIDSYLRDIGFVREED